MEIQLVSALEFFFVSGKNSPMYYCICICLKDIFSDIQLFLGWNNILASLMILWMQYLPPFF